MPAGVKGIEIRDVTKDDGLTIEHELLDAILQGGFDYPGIALRPVITAPSRLLKNGDRG
jgi:hypothetical protein